MRHKVLHLNGFHRIRTFPFTLNNALFAKEFLYFLDEVFAALLSLFSSFTVVASSRFCFATV